MKWAVIALVFGLLYWAGTQSLMVKYPNQFVIALMLGSFLMIAYFGIWKKVEKDDIESE